MERALSGATPGSPGVAHAEGGEGSVLLLFAQTRPERAVLEAWAQEAGRAQAPRVEAGRGQLGELIAGQDGDPEVVPVRVAWLPRERNGDRRAGLRDLVAFNNPRRPSAPAQERIVRQEPERYRVVLGAPARVSELRERFQSTGGERFDTFVERQGVLALERAEREVVGDHYKVPRLVLEDIGSSARFRATVAGLAEESGRELEEVAAEAASALEEMVASQSRLAIDAWNQFGRWLSRAYTVDVDTSRIEELRRLNRAHALVFLPSHRSYLDPLVLRPVLQRHGFPPNHVLGGNNLDFWPLGPVARRNGYVFIRRSFRDAPVYKAVLREYLAYLVRKRFNLEWYIEGGRTRTGKLRPPRYGILRYLVDAFTGSGMDDVFLVPVSIVYDQLHEVGAMAAEEHGATKQAEGLGWIVRYAQAQNRGLGAVHVSFGVPLSLADGLAQDGTVPKIAFEVCHRIDAATPITPTALVTLALLGAGDRARTLEEGRAMVRPLLDYVTRRRLPTTAGVELGKPQAMRRALATLVREGVVTEFKGGTEPVYAIAQGKHLEAAFYRNNVIHHFVTRAIMEVALVRAAEGGFEDRAAEVWEEALRLRDLLKFEFFFPRKRIFAEDLRAEVSLVDPDWERRPAEPEQLRALLAEAPLHLAPRVLRPFVEAYEVVADRLAARDPRSPVEEAPFLDECAGVGRQYLMQRRLDSPESVSRELFRGALRLAGNRDLVDPGREELAERRAALAAEVRDVVRRIRIIGALATGDGEEAPESAWAT